MDGLNICRHLNEYLLTVKYDILIFVAVGSDRLMFLSADEKKNYNKNYEKHKYIPFSERYIFLYDTFFIHYFVNWILLTPSKKIRR